MRKIIQIALLIAVGYFALHVEVYSNEANKRQERTYRDKKYNFEFDYPDNFIVCKVDLTGLEKAKNLQELKEIIVLVEENLLGDALPDKVSIGSVSAITIRPRGEYYVKSKLYRKFMDDKKYHKKIGNHIVATGYPSPYGHAAYAYLLQVDDNLILEFVSDTYRFSKISNSPIKDYSRTNYNEITERIISKIKFLTSQSSGR